LDVLIVIGGGELQWSVLTRVVGLAGHPAATAVALACFCSVAYVAALGVAAVVVVLAGTVVVVLAGTVVVVLAGAVVVLLSLVFWVGDFPREK